MLRYRVATILVVVVVGVLGGCAASSGGERDAVDAMRSIERSVYGGGAGSERRALPELGEHSGLDDYLVYASLNNAGLEAAFNRWKAALLRVPQVRALPDPRFTYAYFIREVETRVGPQEQKVALAQAFPWFGKLGLAGEVALQESNSARERYEAAKLDVFYRVKQAYHELAYLGRAVAITRENIELVKYFEEVARTRYKANLASHPDIIKAQVELGKLEDRLRTLEDLSGPIRARLNAALSRAPDSPLPWPRPIPTEEIVLDDQAVLQWLRESNPELRAIDALTVKAQKATELAKKQYYPDFTLALEYIDTDTAVMPGVRGSGRDPIVAGLSLTLPIWFDKLRAGVDEGRAREVAARRERTEQENRLLARLKKALYDVRDAERKIDLYRDTLIPKADQSLGATQEAYAAERVDFLDLIDAERILLEFRLSYDRAVADHAIGVAAVEQLVGRPLERGAAIKEEPK